MEKSTVWGDALGSVSELCQARIEYFRCFFGHGSKKAFGNRQAHRGSSDS